MKFSKTKFLESSTRSAAGELLKFGILCLNSKTKYLGASTRPAAPRGESVSGGECLALVS